MVLTSDGQKHNLGLSLKFEAKSMKVLEYTRKPPSGRGWEYSDKAIDLIRRYKVRYRKQMDWFYLNVFHQTEFPAVFAKLDRHGDGKKLFFLEFNATILNSPG